MKGFSLPTLESYLLDIAQKVRRASLPGFQCVAREGVQSCGSERCRAVNGAIALDELAGIHPKTRSAKHLVPSISLNSSDQFNAEPIPIHNPPATYYHGTLKPPAVCCSLLRKQLHLVERLLLSPISI